MQIEIVKMGGPQANLGRGLNEGDATIQVSLYKVKQVFVFSHGTINGVLVWGPQ